MSDTNKGIILYDFLFTKGGAEQVTLILHRSLPSSAICVDYLDRDFYGELEKTDAVITLGRPSALTGWQSLKGIHNFRNKTGFIGKYDWVLYSGSNAPVAVHNHPAGLNVLYCHTIPRFAYDLEDYWLTRASWWQAPLLLFLIRLMRRHYAPALEKMDVVVANSENVRRRILKYLGRESMVIHPPCDTERFAWLGQGDYYLSTSRLEPYKRVVDIVRAFLQMPDKKLVVVSGGSELEALKRLAADAENIHFTGWISDEELAELMGKAIATIYIPIDEDFGMSPVESMAAGKPVIGVAEGGLLETIVHGETGLLIPPDPGVSDIVEAVNAMTPDYALSMRGACEARSQLFGRNVFIRKMKAILGIAEKDE